MGPTSFAAAAMHAGDMETSRRKFITSAVTASGAVATATLPGLAKGSRRHLVFGDDFVRRDRDGWGHPWFLQRYGRGWRISEGRGEVRFPPRENSVYYRPAPILVLDHDVADVDIVVTVSASNVTARLGAIARATGYADCYAAYIGPGRILRLTRCGPHHEKLLGRSKAPFESHARYKIRFRVSGSAAVTLKAKVWPAKSPEPERWAIEKVDASAGALKMRGAIGVFSAHAIDGRGAILRFFDFHAWSAERVSVTAPSIAYSLVGPPTAAGATAVALPAVPAQVGFEYGTDPTFSETVKVQAGRTRARAVTAKAELDLSALAAGSVVHWRAFAQRRGHKVFGPAGTFRKAPAPGMPVRIAFGSCTKWHPWPHSSFEQARSRKPDVYLHQGDLGYVAARVVDHAPDCYQDHWTRMLMDPALAGLTREVPFGFYRDDTEYGRNNADASTLRSFAVRAHTEMNANPRGPYFSFRLGDVAVFTLDCRRFSSGRGGPPKERYKIGDVQKQWLFESMRQAKREGASLFIVASPQSFGSDSSAGSWHKNYPAEWDELMNFFIKFGKPLLIISGDAHGHRLHQYPQKVLDPHVPRVLEFTSAGTEQTKFEDGPNLGVVLRNVRGSAFGVIDIGAQQMVNKSKVRTLTLTAVQSETGNILWSETYLAVHNVGIVRVAP